jgi:ribosomal protein L29
MNKKDFDDLKKFGELELREKLNELKNNLYHLRMQLRLSQTKDNAAISRTRRDVARVLTLLKQKP